MEGMLLLSVVMAMLAGAAMVARHRSIAVGAVAVTAAARTEATEIDQEEAKSRKRKSTNEKVSASQGSLSGCIWNQRHTCSGTFYNCVERKDALTIGWTPTLMQWTQRVRRLIYRWK
jgi:hypothetical protein